MTTTTSKTSDKLSITSIINVVHQEFKRIKDPRGLSGNGQIRFLDHLMSGLAIFCLKFPSMLQYDQGRKTPSIARNLKSLYKIEQPPSDTYLRERLDELDPVNLRSTYRKIFALLQRTRRLESFEFLDGYYLMSIDGTEKFSSSKISCKHCCTRVSSNGTTRYYHQMLGAAIVHPDQRQVIPLCPEIIQNQDGHTKNDCERNAAKRFLENFRRKHPHLKVIVVEDGLSSNAPHIAMLEQLGMKYILGAKPGDHEFLFDTLHNSGETQYLEYRDEAGTLYQYHFINGVSLNKSNPDVKVNVVEYRETTSTGKELNFSWVTNIYVTPDNVHKIVQGGRARWKIENETFNTLKNFGYGLEHNYGHGKEHLSTVLCLLMVLAFLIDQAQELSCSLFQEVRRVVKTYRSLWEGMRVIFQYITIDVSKVDHDG